MVNQLYVKFDKVANEASQIIGTKNEELALRTFAVSMEKEKQPEDFELYHLGQFDTETMEIFAKDPQAVNTALNTEEFLEKTGVKSG